MNATKPEFPRERVITDRAYLKLQTEQQKGKPRGWSEYVAEATEEVDAWLKKTGDGATIEAWQADLAAATPPAPATDISAPAAPRRAQRPKDAPSERPAVDPRDKLPQPDRHHG